jgi:hypothetical protein
MKSKKTKVFDLDFRPAYFDDLAPVRPTLHQDSSQVRWLGAGANYLPDYDTGEVEIACLHFESTTGDKISVRARPAGKKICYRIVDEYGKDFTIQSSRSEQPLTLRELVALIDSADVDGDGATGLTSYFRNLNFDEDEDEDPEDFVDFVTVTSDFYGQLEDWYEQEAQEWREKRGEQEEL